MRFKKVIYMASKVNPLKPILPCLFTRDALSCLKLSGVDLEVRMSDTEKVILSIENDTSVRETIVAIVQSLGYTCLEAPNAFRARDILNEQVVDLILLDIHMPGARGNQFLRFIRDRGIHTPVIVISGFLQEKSSRK